jgi:type IV pilus assembly protein PilW
MHASVISRNRGFTLIEIMVAAVIGILAVLVIAQTWKVSESYKRTTTSGGDAEQNGLIGIVRISDDVRQAGYGLNNPAIMGCTVHAYNANTGNTFTFALSPLVIDAAAAPGGNDSITVVYSNSSLITSPATLTQAMPSPAATYKVDNRFGFQPDDLIVATEPGLDCTLAQVTGTPGAAGQSDNVIHNSGNYQDNNNVTHNAIYNKPGGLSISYTTSGSLYNLGPTPTLVRYAVTDGHLTVTSLLAGTAAVDAADGVVGLQAQYGKDTDGDGVVDTWDKTVPTTAAGWQQVVLARIGIVARSQLPERPSLIGGTYKCNTTTTSPTWSGGTFDLSGDSDWECYRYKTYEITVPLRNMIWRLS